MRHHVHRGPQGDGVRPALQHRLAPREQRVDGARPGARGHLRAGHEAVPAVVVAPEHAEGQRARAGQRVEERLLLHGIDLQRADVAEGDLERARLVEAHAADAVAAGRDQAAMAAGEAAHAALGQLFVQLPLAGLPGEEVDERGRRRGHGTPQPEIIDVLPGS